MLEEPSSKEELNRQGRRDRPAGMDSAISALSRVFAVLVLLMAVGGVGAFGDWLLGTSFLMPIGFGLGTLLAVVGMIYVVKIAEIEAKNKRADSASGSDENGNHANGNHESSVGRVKSDRALDSGRGP